MVCFLTLIQIAIRSWLRHTYIALCAGVVEQRGKLFSVTLTVKEAEEKEEETFGCRLICGNSSTTSSRHHRARTAAVVFACVPTIDLNKHPALFEVASTQHVPEREAIDVFSRTSWASSTETPSLGAFRPLQFNFIQHVRHSRVHHPANEKKTTVY